jgi:3-oxoacyl-[acyl-carrier protein] reductase
MTPMADDSKADESKSGSASAIPVKAPRGVLVTGGSRGLGLAIAQKLAAAGYRTVAVARTKSKDVAAAIEQAANAGAGALHFVAFDLGKIDEIPALVRDLRQQFGPLYGLVNNAALGLSGTLAMMHNARIEEMVRVNTLSPMVLTKYVVRSMMAEGAGRVVNVASIVAFTGASGVPVYAATKASMIGFTRSLAREVGPLGITVNAVAPGVLDTEMTHVLSDEQRGQIARRSALNRLAEVGDVADTVEFLLSDKARNITGTVMTVDAGATA